MPESAWKTHLNKYRERHPKATLKDSMIAASKTYGRPVVRVKHTRDPKYAASGTALAAVQQEIDSGTFKEYPDLKSWLTTLLISQSPSQPLQTPPRSKRQKTGEAESFPTELQSLQ